MHKGEKMSYTLKMDGFHIHSECGKKTHEYMPYDSFI